jgi:hypothetical protein
VPLARALGTATQHLLIYPRLVSQNHRHPRSVFLSASAMQCFKWCGAYESLHMILIDNLGRLWTKEGLQGGKIIQQRSELFASQWSLLLQFCISTPVRSLLILVCVCLSLLVLLLIFSWLPHHCSFPELGPFTRAFLVSSCYTLIWLGEQIVSEETLHGTGSLEDPLYWYLLICSHVAN